MWTRRDERRTVYLIFKHQEKEKKKEKANRIHFRVTNHLRDDVEHRRPSNESTRPIGMVDRLERRNGRNGIT